MQIKLRIDSIESNLPDHYAAERVGGVVTATLTQTPTHDMEMTLSGDKLGAMFGAHAKGTGALDTFIHFKGNNPTPDADYVWSHELDIPPEGDWEYRVSVKCRTGTSIAAEYEKLNGTKGWEAIWRGSVLQR